MNYVSKENSETFHENSFSLPPIPHIEKTLDSACYVNKVYKVTDPLESSRIFAKSTALHMK